jgi:hypothetical protein
VRFASIARKGDGHSVLCPYGKETMPREFTRPSLLRSLDFSR